MTGHPGQTLRLLLFPQNSNALPLYTELVVRVLAQEPLEVLVEVAAAQALARMLLRPDREEAAVYACPRRPEAERTARPPALQDIAGALGGPLRLCSPHP